MKILKIVIIIVLVQSFPGCCDPELTNSYLLTDYQKTLITVTDYHDLIYFDSLSNRFIATTQPKEKVIYTENEREEKCKYSEHERMWTFFNFLAEGFVIKVEIDLSYEAKFRLYKINTGAPFGDYFDLSCSGIYNFPIEEQITDISISGFDFKNVFVFENCSKVSDINRILYSPKNGIEFIEYKNGDYYKLNL